jgi:hypothetical protein
MSSIICDYGSQFWGEALFALQEIPNYYYLGLSYGLPSEENDGTQFEDLEPTDVAYARKQIATGPSQWGSNGAGLVTNLNQLTWGAPVVDWGRIEAYALLTAATGGEVICAGEFSEAPYVRSSVPLVIVAGGLSFGLATQAETISV